MINLIIPEPISYGIDSNLIYTTKLQADRLIEEAKKTDEKKRNDIEINTIKSKLKLVQATYEGKKGTYDLSDGKVTLNGIEFSTPEDVEKYKDAVIAEFMECVNELLDVMKLTKEIM